ncbi:dethiobiotin synthase, partial [Pantoea dispersa]
PYRPQPQAEQLAAELQPWTGMSPG